MIIHPPELERHAGHTIVFSKIELSRARDHFPEVLWFRVPDRFAQHISLQGDTFLVPGLIAAMRLKEDLEVRGSVSPRLAYHLDEYQHLLHFRLPGILAPVDIHYRDLKPLGASPAAAGTLFSGGVDSFFTLWKHLPKNQPIPEYRITHALFVLGFDIPNRDKVKYQQLFNRYQGVLDQINVALIPLETNLLSVNVPRLKLVRFDGALLIGAAHLLGGLFGKFFIPSSTDYSMGKTWASVSGAEEGKAWISASDALADPFLSADTLSVLHHGSVYPRAEKIKALSDWELAQGHLRVCPTSPFPDGPLNCSRCEKCLRTMIPIYALGKMDRFKTFPRPVRSNWDSLRWARKCNPALGITRGTLGFIREQKPDLVPYVALAFLAGYLRAWSLRLVPKFLRRWLGRFGYFIDPLAQEGVFDDEEVQGIIQRKPRTQPGFDD
jgi:hypothetical protein